MSINFSKTIKISTYSSEIIEKSIRAKTVKSKRTIEYFSPASWEGKSKFFLGREDEERIYLTRQKTPIERIFFPKAIVEFDKRDFTECKIRLSSLSYFAGILLVGLLLMNLIEAIVIKNYLEGVLGFFSGCLGFIGFALIDMQLVERKVYDSIKDI